MTLDQSFTRDLADAIRSHAPLPEFPPGVSLEEAYAVLPEIAERLCDTRIAGLKAGLTNSDVQALFGLDSALLGFIYDWGILEPGDSLQHREYAQIECELGIILDPSGNPLSIGPALEFVHLPFSRPEDFTGANLVLSSLGADRYLCGDFVDWEEGPLQHLFETTIRLERDGEKLLEVSACDSLGGPDNAVAWCVGEARNRGLDLVESGLLLTGTCGSGIPFQPGHYVADYGSFGRLEFEILAPSC